MQDEDDRKLEALFRSEAIPDRGFSERVVRRIRRRVWIRRWTLPIAMAIGGLIAVRPAVELVSLLPVVLDFVPDPVKEMPLEWLPQLPLVITGLAAAGAMALLFRLLET
ncbi:MAG TPA: hypothetical protein VFG91_03425 [Woeseiaceae bacterium]|nr:hypothetical protein [Woeseiaceae bacterium]